MTTAANQEQARKGREIYSSSSPIQSGRRPPQRSAPVPAAAPVLKTCSSAKSIPCPAAPDNAEINLSRKNNNDDDGDCSESEEEGEEEKEEEVVEGGACEVTEVKRVGAGEVKCEDEENPGELRRAARPRPVRKGGGHKHFRRSRASVNVDDAIEEEDEEAVEAENIQGGNQPPLACQMK